MARNKKFAPVSIPEPPVAEFFFGNTIMSPIWLFVRLYVGWEWLMAGWAKMGSPMWTGENAGVAVKGFLLASLKKTTGEHPDVQNWYAWFLSHIAIPNAPTFSYLVTYGELLVGLALILGVFTGIAAFFGAFMNMNYLFAGTVSSNPLLFLLGIFIMFAWRVAGWYGLDYYILPALGTPWHPGRVFKHK